jgi:hypothetical protein
MATVEEVVTTTVEEYEYMPGTVNVIKRRTVTETRTTTTNKGPSPVKGANLPPRNPKT